MNGYERYCATVRGGGVDIPPRTPILMQFAAEYIGSNYGAFASDHRVLVEANLKCAERFGMDQVSAISDPYRETEGFGGVTTYVQDGVPRCTHPLEESADLSLLKRPDAAVSVRMCDRVEAVRLFKARAGGRYSILGWIEGPAAEAADVRGVQNFLMDLMEEPEFACALMDRCVEAGIEFARAQFEAGADTIGIGDAIASQVSPAVYSGLIQPREKRLVKAIQAMGAWVKLHICGNITHLLPGIADLGVEVLDVDHMVDLRAVRAAVGPKVALTGNIDPAAGVLRGEPAAIRAKMKQCLAEAGAPYMANAGCEIPAGTPEANLLAVCEPLR
ncbi:MAG TPA: uroporphyrinogen decarboxylase family protein [Verrucomicrobiae bacterium]|nr:uroporphyrinogen decarboxylase family protein [Verrucomicrobiae bacterium]